MLFLKRPLKNFLVFKAIMPFQLKMHVKSFMRCINKWSAAHDYEDVKMKLFVLSLEDDASD